MNIFNELTANDVELTREYIESYAGNDDYESVCCSLEAPMDQILAPWASAKEHLYDIFGQEFILRKSFTYAKSVDELAEEIGDMFYEDGNGICMMRNYIYSKYQSVYDRDFSKPFQFNAEAESFDFYNLIDSYTLAYNEWRNESCTIHGVKVQRGAKVIRTLKKIMESFNDTEGLDLFEDFRNAHSQILNQKRLQGELCLSIHPLDYMTMSDNDEGWDSCMSWQNCGDYRQGTVEMMNSPCVVIAYLHNPEALMNIPGGKWNSKKWRCLYIVNKDIIMQVREYPYCNPELNSECLKWLKQLCEDYGEWKYEDTRVIFDANKHSYIQHGEDTISVHFGTNHMYSDFRYTHEGYLNLDAPKRINLHYSGVSECMTCGATDVNMHDNALICDSCNGYITCDYCGESIDPEYSYEVDGKIICQNCYENETYICPICEERDGYETRHLGDDCFDIAIGVGKYITQRSMNGVCREHFKEIQNGGNAIFGKMRFYKDAWGSKQNYVRVEEFTEEGVETVFGSYHGLKRWLDRFVSGPSQWWTNRDIGISYCDTYRMNDDRVARSFIWYDDDGNEAYAMAPDSYPLDLPHCRSIDPDAFQKDAWVLPEFLAEVAAKDEY